MYYSQKRTKCGGRQAIVIQLNDNIFLHKIKGEADICDFYKKKIEKGRGVWYDNRKHGKGVKAV